MKDEAKEILDKAKEISNYGDDGKQHTRMFNQFEAKALLDYITNLQQENERLTNNWNELEEWVKQRIDKIKYNSYDDILDKMKKIKENNENN